MKTALVTGASRGLGKQIADDLEKRGCKVIRWDSSKFDFTKNDECSNALYNIYFKEIDILINNAAIRYGNLTNIMQVNYSMPYEIIRHLLPYMIAMKYGRIVNISSIAADMKGDSYAKSKYALNLITKFYARRYKKMNILINSVSPAMMNTDMLKETKLKPVVPVKEVSKLVVFLCLDNNYITGQNIIIDGGYTL